MSVKNKVRIYKSTIRSILTYANETRAEASKTKQRLRTTKMRVLRSIVDTKTFCDRAEKLEINAMSRI